MDDRKILELYPLPLARGYRRYRNATEARDRHDAGYYLFEIYLKYVASIAIAHYLAGEARDHRVNAVLKGLARPSLGEWLRFLRECLRFERQKEGVDLLIEAMATLFDARDTRWPAVVDLFNAMRAHRTGGSSAKEQAGLDAVLSEVVAYRNRVLGHGANLDSEHYLRFSELFADAFGGLLDHSPFFTARRLVLFDSVQVEEGTRVECGINEFMGLQPVRRTRPLVLQLKDAMPVKHLLYLLADDGTFLLLDPLLVAHREDVYVLNEAQGTPEYLSYASGERHKPSGLGENQEALFERILGYRVNETRLSQIGEEVAATAEAVTKGLKEGERELGDYRIVRELGHGGMGTVFEAIQESLGRRVALKVLPGTFALDPKRLERFRREARATARLHHPNIVPVYEVGEADGTHFYSMEFIDGPSLDGVIARRREEAKERGGRKDSSATDPAYIAQMVEGIAALAEGLEEAHTNGLIHRDIKPSNILVEKSGRWVLVDFGLVHEEAAHTITRSGEMIGTVNYMSPEQVSRRKVDARSDVYSLGVTLYEVLTLRPPFEGTSERDIQNAILFEEPPSPRKLNTRLTRDLETIVLHALETNPDRRYPSAGEFAADLRRFLRYEPIRAKAQSPLTRWVRRARRHRGLVAASCVIALLVVALSLVLVSNWVHQKKEDEDTYDRVVRQAAIEIQGAQMANVDPYGFRFRNDSFRGPAIREALVNLEKIAPLVDDRPDAYFHMARALELLGKKDEARQKLDLALEKDHAFVPALVLQDEDFTPDPTVHPPWATDYVDAQRATKKKEWAKAAEAYGRLIEREEPYPGALAEAHVGRGVALIHAKEYRDARDVLIFAKETWQDLIEPRLFLGVVYLMLHDEEGAEREFEDLYRRALDKDQAALGIAQIYDLFLLNRLEDSLRWVNKMEDGYLKHRARTGPLWLMHRGEEALTEAKAAVALNPDDSLSHNQLGWGFDSQCDWRRAIEAIERAQELDPHDWLPYFSRGYIYCSCGRYEEAVESLKEAAQRSPGNPWPYSMLGVVYRDMNELDKAETAGRKALALAPSDAYATLFLAATLHDKGERGETFDLANSLIEDSRHAAAAHAFLGWLHEREDDLDKAVGAWVQAIELAQGSPGWEAHPRLHALMLSPERPPALQGENLGRVIDRLDRALGPNDRKSYILKTLALVYARIPEKKDSEKSLDYARRCMEKAREDDAEALAVLAEAQFENGMKAEAILKLEEALKHRNATREMVQKLQEYRKRALPTLPSYATIDALLEGGQALDHLADKNPYLEGCLLQRSGKHTDAVAKFLEVVKEDPGAPEPYLRCAASYRALKEFDTARGLLRQALESGQCRDSREIWNCWLTISFVDSDRKPKELLEELSSETESGYGEDIRWLLACLRDDNAVRVNCGHDETYGIPGQMWGRDRFFDFDYTWCHHMQHATTSVRSFPDRIENTTKDLLYQTERRFIPEDPGPGTYRIPLPKGMYTVTLHFAENWHREEGKRSFHVTIEGGDKLQDYDPYAEVDFSAADSYVFDNILVADGILDIEFVPAIGNPTISAIEVIGLPMH